jgi:hypothetical protein
VLCVFSVQLLISCRFYIDCCAHVVLCVFSVQLLISCRLYTDCCAHVLCVFSVQLLISCRFYIDCCAHVAGNPWHCDCDGMYTVYRTFREGTGQNVTLLCDSPEDLRGESWDILEEKCERTVAPPQPAVTRSTANTTAVSTSQPVQFHITVQQNVSLQEPSPDAWHSPPTLLIISLSVFAVAVYSVVVALTVTIRMWRVTRGNDREGTQQVVTAEYSAIRPGPSGVQFRAT